MKKVFLICAATIIVGLTGLPAQADIYKFKDENGVVHFTNMPKGKGYKKVLVENNRHREREYDQIVTRKSSKYNIEPNIIKAVITAESNWDPKALSIKGAIGLMQLMPSTAKDMKVSNPFDPEENIDGGTKYLRKLLNRFDGNLDLALAAYNAGPERVARAGGIPAIAETKKYVQTVNSLYRSRSKNVPVKIYKVTYDDGTVLYTNSNPQSSSSQY